MNNLGKDVEDIIYNYVKQIKYSNVLKEIKKIETETIDIDGKYKLIKYENKYMIYGIENEQLQTEIFFRRKNVFKHNKIYKDCFNECISDVYMTIEEAFHCEKDEYINQYNSDVTDRRIPAIEALNEM